MFRLLEAGAGFTLLEIMLTAVLFVAALFPVLNLYSFSFLATQDAEITTYALNASRSRMEEIKSLEYEDISIGDTTVNLPGISPLTYVNRLLSDSSWTDDLRTIVQVIYVDEDNQQIFQDKGLKKVLVSTAAIQKDGKAKIVIQLATLIQGK